MEQQLEETAVISQNLAASDLFISRRPCLVGNLLLCQLMLLSSHHRHFRDRIYAERKMIGSGACHFLERMACCQPSLFCRRGGEAGKPDHVASGENMGNLSAKLLIGLELSARIGR